MTQIYPARDRYGVGKPGAIGGGAFRRAQVCQAAAKAEAWVYELYSEKDRAVAYRVSQVFHRIEGFSDGHGLRDCFKSRQKPQINTDEHRFS